MARPGPYDVSWGLRCRQQPQVGQCGSAVVNRLQRNFSYRGEDVGVARPETLLRAVILLQESTIKAAVERLLYGAGFDSPVASPSVAALHNDLTRRPSDVVVIDLALCGVGALHSLSSLVDAAGSAAVVVIVPFETLVQPVLELGVTGVVTPRDLRPLVRCLEATREAAHAGLACDCCRRRPAARRRPPPSRPRGSG